MFAAKIEISIMSQFLTAYYNRRAYLSVPLDKYADAENPGQKITIKFKYYTYDKDGTAIESGKYCNPGFEYVPDKN